MSFFENDWADATQLEVEQEQNRILNELKIEKIKEIRKNLSNNFNTAILQFTFNATSYIAEMRGEEFIGLLQYIIYNITFDYITQNTRTLQPNEVHIPIDNNLKAIKMVFDMNKKQEILDFFHEKLYFYCVGALKNLQFLPQTMAIVVNRDVVDYQQINHGTHQIEFDNVTLPYGKGIDAGIPSFHPNDYNTYNEFYRICGAKWNFDGTATLEAGFTYRVCATINLCVTPAYKITPTVTNKRLGFKLYLQANSNLYNWISDFEVYEEIDGEDLTNLNKTLIFDYTFSPEYTLNVSLMLEMQVLNGNIGNDTVAIGSQRSKLEITNLGLCKPIGGQTIESIMESEIEAVSALSTTEEVQNYQNSAFDFTYTIPTALIENVVELGNYIPYFP